MSRRLNKCSCCGKQLPDKLLFCWIDGNNEAITKNSRCYCWRCYNEKYPNDRISIYTILRQHGHDVDFFPEECILVVDGVQYDLKCEPKSLVHKLIEQYNL